MRPWVDSLNSRATFPGHQVHRRGQLSLANTRRTGTLEFGHLGELQQVVVGKILQELEVFQSFRCTMGITLG